MGRNPRHWKEMHRALLRFARKNKKPFMQLYLTKGKVAVIDTEDAERIIEMGMWCAVRDSGDRWYAICPIKRNGSWHNVYLHRAVMNVDDPNVIVDHINGDGLDCRKANLRLATPTQNARNVRVRGRYRGVSWDKCRGKWRARIQVDGKTLFLGYFDTAEEAAKAYDEAALKHHGEFASLNVLTPDCPDTL